MIKDNELRCRAICLTTNNRCSRKYKCKGFLCMQHYKLYGKLVMKNELIKLKILNSKV